MRHSNICAKRLKRFSNSLGRNTQLIFKQRKLWKNFCPGTYLYERARVPLERVQCYKQRRYGRNQEAGDPYYWPRWLDVEEPGVMVPVVRSPDNILVLVAGDPARSRSAYCPARPYNRPVTKKVWLP